MQRIRFWARPPLAIIAHVLFKRSSAFEYAAGASKRSKALWESSGVAEIKAILGRSLLGWHPDIGTTDHHNPECDNRLLLLALWSDEWLAQAFRDNKFRKMYLRVLNDPKEKRELVGIFPDSARTWRTAKWLMTFAAVPLMEIFRQVVLPDLLQLQHGIQIATKKGSDVRKYIGALHMLIGDHVELCEAAGITTGTTFL